ncbi:hypothetical protein ACFOW1_05070 [Parasediminibacterium paludis]|uniref:Uncharacterized protein n=1 Tax=Parasediminibacterium paludis TaxID=908966 RepID=A0ABV8PWV7_9BACT
MKEYLKNKNLYSKNCQHEDLNGDYDNSSYLSSKGYNKTGYKIHGDVIKIYFVPNAFHVWDAAISLNARPRKISKVEKQFYELAQKWKNETAVYSTVYHKTINNNYLGIIGIGYEAVPFILKDLQKSADHWFIALKAITKENPVPREDMGNMHKMKEAWIQWGINKGLIR